MDLNNEDKVAQLGDNDGACANLESEHLMKIELGDGAAVGALSNENTNASSDANVMLKLDEVGSSNNAPINECSSGAEMSDTDSKDDILKMINRVLVAIEGSRRESKAELKSGMKSLEVRLGTRMEYCNKALEAKLDERMDSLHSQIETSD